MSSPSTKELDQQFRAFKEEIRQRFLSDKGAPSRRGGLLLSTLNCVEEKAREVWRLRRQVCPRPDRHYPVGFALTCDLEILGHYVQIGGPVSKETIASWAVGLIAPLNEAILGTQDGKADLNVSQLVQGLPKELVDKCAKFSTDDVASARAEMSPILAHNISNAVTTVLKIADPETMPRWFTNPVHQLAEYLLSELDTVEKVERFDIAVTAADFNAFRGLKPVRVTTYASWILDALYCVGTSLRPDPTALSQAREVEKWCDSCLEIVNLGLKQWGHLISTGEAGFGTAAGQHPSWSRKNSIYAAAASDHNNDNNNHHDQEQVDQHLNRIDSGLGFPSHHHRDN